MKLGDFFLYFNVLVKVIVIKFGYIVIFINVNGEKGFILNFSVVDGIEVMFVIFSDEVKMLIIKDGRIL